MSQIFIMALEPLETRYTGQWFTGLPLLLEQEAKRFNRDVTVHNIAGEQVENTVTDGAFLNFSATNIWKNTQLNAMAEKFADGSIKPGDHVLFTDAWHTGVQQIKYMSELLDIPVVIHSMWHAGSYDPQDFLGRKIKDKTWSLSFERSVFFASDYNYFATEFHIKLFMDTVLKNDIGPQNFAFPIKRVVRAGQPHNLLVQELEKFKGKTKKRQVLFPHRIAPEKQPEIFRDLAAAMPDVKFIICQESKLTKDEYHTLLAESMIVFSANLQETLGISAMEGIIVDTLPLLPNRLSYTEMYVPEFLYPSEWTENWASYETHKDKLVARIYDMLDNYGNYRDLMIYQDQKLRLDYLDCGNMTDRLIGQIK